MHAWARLAWVTLVGCRTYDVVYTDDGGTCGPPHVMCNGLCVDPTSDRTHCGTCSTTCNPNELCQVPSPGVTARCVACAGSRETVCGTSGGAFCTDLSTDDQNCGTCDVKCPHGAHCASSQCVCTLTSCATGDGGTECVDVQSDVNHCGACTAPCPTPQLNETAICSAGKCSQVCIAPFADCDGIGSNGCETNIQTSGANCGMCGRTCSGGACTSGVCPVTSYTPGGSQFAGLAVDSSFVYWADDSSSSGAIFKTPIGGGSPQTVYATPAATILGLDGARIAWMSNTTQINSRLLTGGTVTALATLTNGVAMVTAAGYVYYSTTDGKVWRVPSDGSSGAVTITSTSFEALSLAVDATNVYFADQAGNVFDAPIGAQSATAKLFASGQSVTSLTLDATKVYWTSSTGDITSQVKGATSSKILVSGQTQPQPITTDGAFLYWATGDGNIRRVASAGGVSFTLATKQPPPSDIAVDSTNVYWTSPVIVGSTTK